jgi:hypothetical protein
MVTVSITAKAFAAIEAMLPEGSEAEARRTVRALFRHVAAGRPRQT